uniref:Uncharacterized protein n=1 Tax=Anguilla anguilla TaxID=7936 RepID=A0A0E9WVY6_ANGAN
MKYIFIVINMSTLPVRGGELLCNDAERYLHCFSTQIKYVWSVIFLTVVYCFLNISVLLTLADHFH